MTSFARELALHTRSVAAAEIPEELAGWVRTLLFDHLAVAGGGVRLASSRAVVRSIAMAAHRSEMQPAPVLGTRRFASVADAALVAGTTGHGLELDDTFEEGSSHPGVVVFPAVAAVAAAYDSTWDEVLRASIAGYDVMCGVGVQLGAAEAYGRGFHPTGVAGALGAAAAASVLLGLDEQETTMAISLAANMTAGSLEFLSDGSWTKRLNAGNAAAVGTRAATLAAAGFVGPETAIEGRDGFLAQYGRGGGRLLGLSLGAGARDTSIKFYPCCRYMHGGIDLLRALHDEVPGVAGRVASVQVAVIEAGATLVADPPERKLVIGSPVDAQFSMPFGAAVALATGKANVAQFDDAPTVAKAMADLMAKVTCVRSEALETAYPRAWQAEIRVELQDGTVIERREPAFRGAPGNRATEAEIREKAADLVGAASAASIWAALSGLRADAPFVDGFLNGAYESLLLTEAAEPAEQYIIQSAILRRGEGADDHG